MNRSKKTSKPKVVPKTKNRTARQSFCFRTIVTTILTNKILIMIPTWLETAYMVIMEVFTK